MKPLLVYRTLYAVTKKYFSEEFQKTHRIVNQDFNQLQVKALKILLELKMEWQDISSKTQNLKSTTPQDSRLRNNDGLLNRKFPVRIFQEKPQASQWADWKESARGFPSSRV